MFKKIPGKQTLITKEITSKLNYQEELTLKNNFKILLKENDSRSIRISFYLENPPLYQTQINAGIEKIILLYVKRSLTEKFISRMSIIPDMEIFSSKDMSGISVSIDKDHLKNAVNIFSEALRIQSFNAVEINRIKDEQLKFFNSRQADMTHNLDMKFERHVFKSSPLQSPVDGNSISLKVIGMNDIANYYKNYFNVKRAVLFICGDLEKKDFLISDFSQYENLNFNSEIPDSGYEKLESRFFNLPPVYYTNPAKDGKSYFEAIYSAPSFLNDDYFGYLVANRMLSDNFKNCTEIIDMASFSPLMLNMTNFGKMQFKADEKNTVDMLLSFKKVLSKTKKGTGIFYYWKDSVNDPEKDYGSQDENKLSVKILSSVLESYKKDIFENFNFTVIESPEKERRFVSIYFLLNQMIDSAVIKERIDGITENDIMRIYQRYFNKFVWSVMSSDGTIKNLSGDFFSAVQ